MPVHQQMGKNLDRIGIRPGRAGRFLRPDSFERAFHPAQDRCCCLDPLQLRRQTLHQHIGFTTGHATGAAIAAMIGGAAPPFDTGAFSPSRYL